MNNDNITILEKVMKATNKDTIIFDRINALTSTYRISNNMQCVIANSFGLLYQDKDKRYSNDVPLKHSKNGNMEVLIDGPIRYTTYNEEGYSKGFVDRIDMYGISYSSVPNSNDIRVDGQDNYSYSSNISHGKVIDTNGKMNYTLYYGSDGIIKNIIASFGVYNMDRNTGSLVTRTEVRNFEFNNFNEFLAFKNNLKDYNYVGQLYNTDYNNSHGMKM